MSHLTTPNSVIVNDKYTIEYADADREVRRRYIVSQVSAYAVLAGGLYWMLASIVRSDLIGLVATLVVGIAVLSYSIKVGEIHHQYQPVKQRRKFTREVFRFVREHHSIENVNWSPRASYTVDIELLDAKKKLMRLTMRNVGDPMLRMHAYEISPTSIVTVRGPKFEVIYPDLKLMLQQHDNFGESDRRIADTFEERLDVSRANPAFVSGIESD